LTCLSSGRYFHLTLANPPQRAVASASEAMQITETRTLTHQPFPEPIVINDRNFWRRGAVRRWLAEVAGEPAPKPRPDDEQLMTQRAVREHLGGVSEMWIWRKRQRKSEAA
jgi:hypothetical protein